MLDLSVPGNLTHFTHWTGDEVIVSINHPLFGLAHDDNSVRSFYPNFYTMIEYGVTQEGRARRIINSANISEAQRPDLSLDLSVVDNHSMDLSL